MWPETNSTFKSGRIWRARSASSRPPISGITASLTSRLIDPGCSHTARASRPSFASRTIYPRLKNPLEGYRRLTFMMLDADIVAVSPSSVWRVLSQAGLLSKWNVKPSKKGTGFGQPLAAHEHWHVDISYLNIGGTSYYLCSILDGYSRYIVNWDIRESMTEADIEIILQGAKEKYANGMIGKCYADLRRLPRGI